MATKSLIRPSFMPSLMEDFFKPLNQWFDDSGLVSRVATIPAINIKENADNYLLTVAAPGLKKEDFRLDVDNNMLTISSEKEVEEEEKEGKITRKEYSYTSFTRSFTLPEDVKQEAIDARYENGELKIVLPRKEDSKKPVMTQRIPVN